MIIEDFKGGGQKHSCLQIYPKSFVDFLKYIWKWVRPFNLHQRFSFFLLVCLRYKLLIQDYLVRTGEEGESKKAPDEQHPEGMGRF